MSFGTELDLGELDTEIRSDAIARLSKLPSDFDPAAPLEELKDDSEATAKYAAAISVLAYLILDHPDSPASSHANLAHLIIDKLVSLRRQNLWEINSSEESDLLAQTAEAALFALVRYLTTAALPQASLLALLPYTDTSQPWTAARASRSAEIILDSCLGHEENRDDFLLSHVLQGYLRPIFSRAAAVRVTDSGRPQQYAVTGTQKTTMEEPAWKVAGAQVVSIFAWAVNVADSSLIAKNWPLFMPPLLAIAEDGSNSVRATGLKILTAFISKCPNTILQTTGIAAIFQDAIFPTLLFLPSLTPEKEAVQMLQPAYGALLQLVEKDDNQPRRVKLLDKTLRDGVLAGFYHAGEYADIVIVLMEVTAEIVTCMGLSCVKHLQALLSMFSAVLTDPFADARPETVLQAAKAQNAVVQNAWPRIMSDAPHEGQIINAISLCWLTMRGKAIEVSKKSRAIRSDIEAELKITGKMIMKLRKERALDLPPLLKDIFNEEPSLSEVFQED